MIVTRQWAELAPITNEVAKTQRVWFESQGEQLVYLRKLAWQYGGLHALREIVVDIVFRQKGCPPKAKVMHATAIGEWVQEHITYVNEGFETFQTPYRTLRSKFGDCDDFAILICAMLEAIGIKNEMVGIKLDGSRFFSHIFARAVVPKGAGAVYVPLDATLSTPIKQFADPLEIAARQGHRVQYVAL